jgi:hypothetical protein
MLTTTLNHVQKVGLSTTSWQRLLAHLGKTESDDKRLPYATILHVLGLDDALLCCRAEPRYARQWRMFAVRCASHAQHLLGDSRDTSYLDVARRYADGQATKGELVGARHAASGVVKAAAVEVAWKAAGLAAMEAAHAAAESRANATAAKAARIAARGVQVSEFLRLVG